MSALDARGTPALELKGDATQENTDVWATSGDPRLGRFSGLHSKGGSRPRLG